MSRLLSSLLAVTILTSVVGAVLAQNDDPSKDHATLTPNGSSATLDIDSARTVFHAVQILEQRYGYVITYEDPSYVYSDDVTDATGYVRKDHRRAGPGVRRIMLPRSSKLSIEIPATSCISTTEMASLLQQLVAVQQAGSRGGHFRAEQTESGIFHVIPTEVRDSHGNMAPELSPLDVRISFPVEARTEGELLQAIANDVSVAAHVHVGAIIGSGIVIGIRPRHPYQFNIGADDETARDVLTRVLQQNPTKQSWALIDAVEEGGNQYLLDITDASASAFPCRTPPLPVPPAKAPSTSGCMNCAPPQGH